MLLLIYIFGYIYCIQTINFDDIDIRTKFCTVPRPYNNFVFYKINSAITGYIDDNIRIINTKNIIPHFISSSTSFPNIISTTGENLSIIKVNNSNFDFVSINITSIFIDQIPINITSYKEGIKINSYSTRLAISVPEYIILNWINIDQIIIGCSEVAFNACAHLAYDDIVVN